MNHGFANGLLLVYYEAKRDRQLQNDRCTSSTIPNTQDLPIWPLDNFNKYITSNLGIYVWMLHWVMLLGVSLLPGVELVERDRVAGVTGGMLLVGGAGILASGDSGILLFSR